jgi:hypothetical protein
MLHCSPLLKHMGFKIDPIVLKSQLQTAVECVAALEFLESFPASPNLCASEFIVIAIFVIRIRVSDSERKIIKAHPNLKSWLYLWSEFGWWTIYCDPQRACPNL